MKSNGIMAMEMEMEPALEKGGEGFEDERVEQERQCNPCFTLHTLWLLICAYADYYQGVTVTIMSLLVITGVIALLDHIAYSSTSKTHKPGIRHDYSNVNSLYDLQLANIDHWCLTGGDDNCRCDDPTIGLSNEQTKGWTKAHKLNKKIVSDVAYAKDLDVVFLGDAAIEELNGRWLGSEKEELSGIKKNFQKTFTVAGGGEVNGLALGVAGDTIANLRWRVQHGEIPASLNPKIWWILIGSNDLGRGQCSEEAVLLGIMKLAEEISLLKPNSVVVINSILPRPKIKVSKHGKKLHLWPYIQIVNSQLEHFCSKHEKDFHYFDAHSLFVNEGGKKGHISIKTALMADGTHLTLEGHKVWGKAILDLVKDLKSKLPAIVAPDTTSYANTEQNYDFSDDNYYGGGDDGFIVGGGDESTVTPTTASQTAAEVTAGSGDGEYTGNMDDYDSEFYDDDFARL